MFVKRFKRKCDVRGCKNTANVYLISKRREMGNTIAMCRDCMKEALTATENYTEPAKVKKEVKPLFPHPELDVTISSAAVNEPESEPLVIEDKETAEALVEALEKSVEDAEGMAVAKPKATSNKKTNKKK